MRTNRLYTADEELHDDDVVVVVAVVVEGVVDEDEEFGVEVETEVDVKFEVEVGFGVEVDGEAMSLNVFNEGLPMSIVIISCETSKLTKNEYKNKWKGGKKKVKYSVIKLKQCFALGILHYGKQSFIKQLKDLLKIVFKLNSLINFF